MDISELDKIAVPFDESKKQASSDTKKESKNNSSLYQFSFNPDTNEFVVEKEGKIIQSIKITTISGKNGDTWTPQVLPNGELTFIPSDPTQKPIGPFQLNGKDGKDFYTLWKEHQQSGNTEIKDFFAYFKGQQGTPGKDGKDGIDGANGNDGKDGATFIPHITKEGELFFTSNKSSDRISVGNVKGADGKTFYPHIDGTELYFTEDEEGKGPELFRIDLKGETGNDGRTYVPQMDGTKLHFDDLAGHTTSEVDLRGKDAFELWKEHHHKPDATYEEFEEYFKGQNIKSEYNYLDIKDAQIPIQRINRTLITDSDLTDGMTIEDFYEHRKKRIKDIRKAGAEITDNGFKEFFWWCAGADAPLLRMCPADHSKYVGIGTVIFFTALMAFFSCFTAMQLVFGGLGNDANIGLFAALPLGVMAIIFICRGIRLIREEKRSWLSFVGGGLAIIGIVCTFKFTSDNINMTNVVAAIIALIWAAMIFFLDRFITNTMYSDGKTTISWLEFRSGLPRIVISIFLGIVISAPLELKIFKQEIVEYIKVEKNANIENKIDSTEEYTNAIKTANVLKSEYEQAEAEWKNVLPNKEQFPKKLTTNNTVPNGTKDRKHEDGTIEQVIAYQNITREETGVDQEKYQNAKNAAAEKKDTAKDKYIAFANDSLKQIRQKIKQDLAKKYNDADSVGLYAQLEAMHKIALKNFRPLFGSSINNAIIKRKNSESSARDIIHSEGLIKSLASLLCFVLLWVIGKSIYLKKYGKYNDKELTDNEKIDKKIFWYKYMPLIAIASLILGLGLGTWHQLLTFLFTPVGLIMLLFILIDVSPVFYKMMLADGEYDKMHYQDKMIEQDFIRLQVAKAMYKVNESELSKLSPFIFGKTFDKAERLMEKVHDDANEYHDEKLTTSSKSTSNETKSVDDSSMSALGEKIKGKNKELFEKVLDMKYRIAYAAYAAWYRDMRDYIMGKKDDAKGATIKPENTLSDDIPNEETSNKQEEDARGEQSSTENWDDMTM